MADERTSVGVVDLDAAVHAHRQDVANRARADQAQPA